MIVSLIMIGSFNQVKAQIGLCEYVIVTDSTGVTRVVKISKEEAQKAKKNKGYTVDGNLTMNKADANRAAKLANKANNVSSKKSKN